MLTLTFQGGPHHGARFELPEEMDHFPDEYTFRGEVYERTLVKNHAGELIYVYKGPEPRPVANEPDGAA